MLYEYALEPSLLNTWNAFRYFTEHFGISHGRFISRYPRTWKRMVYESLTGCPDVERKRIEVRLQEIDDRLIPRQSVFDKNRDWLRNAEVEHAARPFRAIVAGSNPRSQPFVLDGHELNETEPLWKSPATITVPRQAAGMADAVRPLLARCKALVLVDPHFGPENARHRRPFEAFMNALVSADPRRQFALLEYHTGDKATADFFESESRRRLTRLIPAGLTIRLVRWRQAELHNRFILTDLGGFLIGQGLDEDDGAGPATDEYCRLDGDTLLARWADFITEPAFTFVDAVTIVGTKS